MWHEALEDLPRVPRRLLYTGLSRRDSMSSVNIVRRALHFLRTTS
jgi:hypothetical protein